MVPTSVPVSSSPATVTAQAASPVEMDPAELDAEGITRVGAMNINDALDAAVARAASPENNNDDDDGATAQQDLGGGVPPPPPVDDGPAVSTAAPTAPLGPPWTGGEKSKDDTTTTTHMPEVFKHAAEKLNPVAAKMKTAAAAAATTFNATVVPKTAAVGAEVRQGWKNNFMPGLNSGGARMASFFGKVGEKMKETNSKLREKNDTFRKMGDGLSHGASTTFEAMKTGGAELRTEIKHAAAEVRSAAAEVIYPGVSAAPAPGVPPLANFDFPLDKATTGAETKKSPGAAAAAAAEQELKAETAAADAHLGATATTSDAQLSASSSTSSAGTAGAVTAGNPAGAAAAALASAPTDPGGVLRVPLEQLAAWEAHTKPVPYAVLACCHWLSAAGLQTEGIFRGEGSRPAVERLVGAVRVESSCDPYIA
jgi:hypothetical protein